MIIYIVITRKSSNGDYCNIAHLRDLMKFRHGEILQLLSTVDDIIISVRTLRQRYRGQNEFNPLKITSFLNDQLEGQGRLHHLSCLDAARTMICNNPNFKNLHYNVFLSVLCKLEHCYCSSFV